MRTANFAMLPAEMSYYNRRDALFQSNAMFRVTGKGDHTVDELLDTNQGADVMREFSKQVEAFEKSSVEKRNEYFWGMGVLVVNSMVLMVPKMHSSMDALLVSIVLESWLFFEAFCSDLWVASVDNGGKTISNRLGLFQG